MKNINKKSVLITSIVVLCLVASLFFTSFISTFAQSGQNQQTDTKDINCSTEMRPFLEEKSKEFRDYLTTHLQNKSTNSSLLDLALRRFKEYQKELNKKFQTYYPQAGLPQYSETLDTLTCHRQMTQEISLMEQLLRKYFKETSNIKTTSALMTKLKEINKKLDELNRNVTEMYGKWGSFKDRIPCYIGGCIGG